MLRQSHDVSHDSNLVSLMGSTCINIVHDLPAGALGAYSAFIAALIDEELLELPRGLVHAAMKKAAVVSMQEMVLRRATARMETAAARTGREVGRTAAATSLTTSFAKCELLNVLV